MRNLDVLPCMVQSGGAQAAVDWLKRIPDYARDASAGLGTAFHAAAEVIGRGEPGPTDDAVRPYLAAYRRDLLELRLHSARGHPYLSGGFSSSTTSGPRGASGFRSRSTPDNLVLLGPAAHRAKALDGRHWRPVLLAWIEAAERGLG